MIACNPIFFRHMANVVLHVALMASFLAIFYFTFVANVEKEIVSIQAKNLVESIVQVPIAMLTPQQRAYLYYQANKVKLPDMSEEDAEVEKSNSDLLTSAIKFVVTIVSVAIAIVLILWGLTFYLCGHTWSLSYLFAENLYILVFVGLTEFAFLMLIAKNYASLDPNIAKKQLLKTTYDYVSH